MHEKVPVLVAPPAAPLADSLAITYYLAQFYPMLIPAAYKSEIRELLEELHTLNFFTLSFSNRPQPAQALKNAAHNLLARKDISEPYRDALNYKLKV